MTLTASQAHGAPGAVVEATAVPDALAPPPRHPRFPLVDGMRAIAVLAVVLLHAAWFGGGISSSFGGRLLAHLNIGVTIFFLISGFLLYRPFIAHRGGGAPAPATPDYFKRRFLRIYPAYWLILTFLIVAPGFTGVIGGNAAQMYTLTHTLPVGGPIRCSTQVNVCGLAQTWSLVVELTFYIALPLFALALERATRGLGRRAWVVAQLAVLAALSALSVAIEYEILSPAPLWFGWSVLGNVFWFALGMGMAVLSVGVVTAPRPLRAIASRPLVLWAAALAAYVALTQWLPPTPFIFSRGDELAAHLAFGAIAALLLIPAVYADGAGGLPRRLLAHPVMAWLGLISYGIFLWHYAIALKLGSPGAKEPFGVVLLGTLAISIAAAAASYYLVERPVLQLKYRRLRDLVRERAPLVQTTGFSTPRDNPPR